MIGLTALAALALSQVVDEVGAAIGHKVYAYWTDPSQALPQAIAKAQDQTWKMVEMALAEDSLGATLRRAVARGTLRGANAPLRALIAERGDAFRTGCLAELRAARRAGLLTVGSGQELAQYAAGVNVLATPEHVLEQARQAMTEMGAGLGAEYPRLVRLLTHPLAGGPLLLGAFGYFLRQEIATNERLREALNFERLERLWQGQAQGFADLRSLLTEQGEMLARELAWVGDNLDRLAQGQAEQQALLQEILQRVAAGDRHGPVRPGLSSVLRASADSVLFAELQRRLDNLPPERRSPELLDALGRLGMAVGGFAAASDLFQQAADQTTQDPAQAEAHYNAFRALLEQQRWDAALTALREAVRLDPDRFEPFPLQKYAPQRILGAGGFGVAFLCQHAHLGHQVVIKTLYSEELERNLADVFREGQILKGLRHPAIIQVEDSDYAGRDQQRLRDRSGNR